MSAQRVETQRAMDAAKRLWAFATAHATLMGCLAAVLLLGVFAALWLLEHDASLKREFEFRQMRQQAASEVAALRARAAAALGELEKNARLMESLEARRRGLEREAEDLRQRLHSLREEERVRVQQASTLAPTELAQRVAARLGPEAQASGKTENGNWKLETGHPPVASSQLSVPTDNRPRMTNDSKFQIQDLRTNGAVNRQSPLQGGNNRQSTAPATGSSSEFPISNFQFPLTERGLRQVETAFLQLDACREQGVVQEQRLANCEDRARAAQAETATLGHSVSQLQEAVRLKDEIAARTEAEHRAELQAARGTRRGRFVRALEYIGVGVVIGSVVR
ncbi:MAG: hypothetical protein LAN62_16700 [Acidobacteriia bacterium]|nr:hypothetical protein [Terriglobia bacterium]